MNAEIPETIRAKLLIFGVQIRELLTQSFCMFLLFVRQWNIARVYGHFKFAVTKIC